jgi:hypothetical protein
MGGNKIQYLILVVNTESFCLKAGSGEYWGTEFVTCLLRMGHKFRKERMMGAFLLVPLVEGRTSPYKSHDRTNISGVKKPSVEFCFVLRGK